VVPVGGAQGWTLPFSWTPPRLQVGDQLSFLFDSRLAEGAGAAGSSTWGGGGGGTGTQTQVQLTGAGAGGGAGGVAATWGRWRL